MNKKLYRNEYHRTLGGVCSGLADYFEMDVTIVRLLFVFTAIVMVGTGVLAYIILWVVLPRKGVMFNNFNNPVVDYRVPPQQPAGDFNAPPSSSPYGSNPFASNTNSGNPFGGNQWNDKPFNDNYANVVPPKKKSHAGVIIGAALIILGAIILIDNYDLFPDIDFETYWPLVLVVIGGGLIISGQKSEMWHKKDWSEADKAAPATEEPSTPTDSNPTV
jgi:phage shock protein C